MHPDVHTQTNPSLSASGPSHIARSSAREYLGPPPPWPSPPSSEASRGMNAGAHTYHTIQYNTIQYTTLQYNTVHYTTLHYTTRQDKTRQDKTRQYNTIQYNTTQYNTIQYNTTQHNTTQYNPMQCNAMQCNAMQCNAIQYNTIHMLPPPPKAHRFHDFRHNLAWYCSASSLCRHQAARTQEAGTLARTPTLGSRKALAMVLAFPCHCYL